MPCFGRSVPLGGAGVDLLTWTYRADGICGRIAMINSELIAVAAVENVVR